MRMPGSRPAVRARSAGSWSGGGPPHRQGRVRGSWRVGWCCCLARVSRSGRVSGRLPGLSARRIERSSEATGSVRVVLAITASPSSIRNDRRSRPSTLTKGRPRGRSGPRRPPLARAAGPGGFCDAFSSTESILGAPPTVLLVRRPESGDERPPPAPCVLVLTDPAVCAPLAASVVAATGYAAATPDRLRERASSAVRSRFRDRSTVGVVGLGREPHPVGHPRLRHGLRWSSSLA